MPPHSSAARGRGGHSPNRSSSTSHHTSTQRGRGGTTRGRGRGSGINNNNNNNNNNDGLTLPATRVTPFAASQSQPAQHGAAVVRSGSAPTQGGSIHFFSSVQVRGGAFTQSERETQRQLQRRGAIARGDAHATVAHATSGATMERAEVVREAFNAMQAKRAREEVAELSHVVKDGRSTQKTKSRFEVPSDDDDDDDV